MEVLREANARLRQVIETADERHRAELAAERAVRERLAAAWER
ncbi:hypothetical protein [Frankia sp. CiP1_Cm_nod1]